MSHPNRDRAATPSPRRWPRRLAVTLGALTILTGGVMGWAALSVDTSLWARTLTWREADTDDWRRFPMRTIAASPDPVEFERGELLPGALETVIVDGQEQNLTAFMEETGTTAFMVLQGDRLLVEQYFNGSSRDATQTSFSVAKSFVSTLIGIAIEEGFIGSLDDSVVDYIPELGDTDPRTADITIRNLVSMSSGLRYVEMGAPWSDDARTYYSPDLRAAGLSVKIEDQPGATFLYNNYNPLLLGMVLERATGMSVAAYLETRLWQPMGAEAPGSWSLDSDASGFEKMESGINGRAIDFLKLGWVFLHQGRNGDAQVVPAEWVADATMADTREDPASFYQYFWWIDTENDAFFAEGNHGQFIYVAPDHDVVVLRMGTEYGSDAWRDVLPQIVAQLSRN